jgi:4-amino-4-deoxy-L-arabinose transferase-like glycosyltransferase
LITILLALGSVFLTFLLGKKLFNEKVGLLSAVFISLSLYHVQNSAWATLDIPNCFFLVLTVYLAFNMYEKRTVKSYILTGVSLGILTGTKYIGAVVLISILLVHFYHKEEKFSFSSFRKNLSSKNLWLLIISAVIVFLLTTPGIMLRPKSFAHSLLALFFRDAGRGYNEVFGFGIFLSAIKNYSIVTDPFLTVVMILGLLIPFKKRLDKDVPVLIIIIIFLIAFGSSLASRQIIAVLPLTSVLGAGAVSIAYNKIKFISRPIWITILFLWISFALVYNLFGIHLRNNDTRTEAAYFIKSTLPEGSSIGATSIGNYLRWDWMFPKIDTLSYKVINALEQPQFLILTSYDFKRMEEALKSDNLNNYSWDPEYSYKWYRGKPPSEEVFRFYDEVLNNKGIKYKYRLIKKFEKNVFIPIEFPPPYIWIYEKFENQVTIKY